MITLSKDVSRWLRRGQNMRELPSWNSSVYFVVCSIRRSMLWLLNLEIFPLTWKSYLMYTKTLCEVKYPVSSSLVLFWKESLDFYRLSWNFKITMIHRMMQLLKLKAFRTIMQIQHSYLFPNGSNCYMHYATCLHQLKFNDEPQRINFDSLKLQYIFKVWRQMWNRLNKKHRQLSVIMNDKLLPNFLILKLIEALVKSRLTIS